MEKILLETYFLISSSDEHNTTIHCQKDVVFKNNQVLILIDAYAKMMISVFKDYVKERKVYDFNLSIYLIKALKTYVLQHKIPLQGKRNYTLSYLSTQYDEMVKIIKRRQNFIIDKTCLFKNPPLENW